MKKPSKLLWVLIAGFSILILGIVLSKNFTRIQSLFISQDTLNERAKDNPQFWYEATPVQDEDGLYLMENPLFSGELYNDVYKFGDNLLLAGSGQLSSAIDTSDIAVPFNNANLNQYTFTVYSPWQDRILYSICPEEMFYSSYQVVGDYIFLFRKRDFSVDIYDKTLSKVGKFELSPYYTEENVPCFLPSQAEMRFYMTDEEEQLYFADFSSNKPQIVLLDSPYAQIAFGSYDTDSATAICSALNKATLRYELLQVDLKDFSVLQSFPGTHYPLGYTGKYGILASTNINANYWCINSTCALPAFFQEENCYPIGISPSGNFVFRYAKDTSDLLCSYDKSGTLLSDVEIANNQYYLSYHHAYFPDENLVFLLGYSQTQNPVIYIWEPENTQTKEAAISLYSSEKQLSYYAVSDANDSYRNIITLVPDTKSYDWGDLSLVRQKADSLEKKYGISIYLGPEVPSQIDCYQLAPDFDTESIDTSLTQLSAVLDAYPDAFFDQLCCGDNRSLHIYLSGSISGSTEGMLDEPSAYVNSINSYMVMVLDTHYQWDWEYIINHEISHLIDKRLLFDQAVNDGTLFSEDTWATYNPEGFSYLNTYEGYETSHSYSQYQSYFIDSYGITFATEDRAELFGNAMWNAANGINDQAIYADDTPTREKYAYYCRCIRDSFDTTTWNSTTSWELVLEK